MRLAPGDDMWMVRVTRSGIATPTGPAGVERWTAVDLDPDDSTPGVYPLLHESGRMEAAPHGAWLVRRTRIEAFNDSDARDATAAMYDAARGFLALGLAPTGGTALDGPGLLSLEIGDDAWSFALDAVPAQALAVLRAAEDFAARGVAAA